MKDIDAWVEDTLRNFPFLVDSLVEKTTSPGSYDREVGRAVAYCVRVKVEECIKRLCGET